MGVGCVVSGAGDAERGEEQRLEPLLLCQEPYHLEPARMRVTPHQHHSRPSMQLRAVAISCRTQACQASPGEKPAAIDTGLLPRRDQTRQHVTNASPNASTQRAWRGSGKTARPVPMPTSYAWYRLCVAT